MKFQQTTIPNVYIIEPDKKEDERGFFARSFCINEFKQIGIETSIVQSNISFNLKKGTLRGLHYQEQPKEEAKLVRCTKGAVYDVIVDLRPSSPSYKKWVSVELTEENRKVIYIPKGCAHGFQTLSDNTEVFYEMFELFSPEHSRGIAYNDPTLKISWPLPVSIISEKDKRYPFLKS